MKKSNTETASTIICVVFKRMCAGKKFQPICFSSKILLENGADETYFFFFLSSDFKVDFTLSTKTLAGLKAGMKCSGISIDLFALMLRPTLRARFFAIKLPKPRT
jgi:hypothetical protein